MKMLTDWQNKVQWSFVEFMIITILYPRVPTQSHACTKNTVYQNCYYPLTLCHSGYYQDYRKGNRTYGFLLTATCAVVF
jgi:hypothetical protein